MGLYRASYEIFKNDGQLVLYCEHLQTVKYREPEKMAGSGGSEKVTNHPAPGSPAEQGNPAMKCPIVDTHQHLIYPEKSDFSWTKGIAQLETRAFRYDDYLGEIEGTRIASTIFVETAADSWREEAQYVYKLATHPDSLIAASWPIAVPRKRTSRNISNPFAIPSWSVCAAFVTSSRMTCHSNHASSKMSVDSESWDSLSTFASWHANFP